MTGTAGRGVRVALVHSFYASDQSSGENVVVAQQADALARAGATVLTLGRHTDAERHRTGYPVRAAWRTVTQSGPDPTERLLRFGPDVVHVHNTVPNVDTRWLAEWRGPVVHTLHNFRPLCANALLYRDGAGCTLCPDGRPWSAVRYGCYRSSAVASLPLAVRNGRGLDHNRLLRRADRLIALSPFAAGVYRRYGADPHRLRVVPNGLPARHSDAGTGPAVPHYVYAGRLRDEKGIAELVASWPPGVRLDVLGDGPLLPALRVAAPDGVRFLGPVPRDEVRDRIRDATALLFPSLWPEPAVALVVVEALEAGVPVIAAQDGSQTEGLVADGVARAVGAGPRGFDAAGLGESLHWAAAGGTDLRRACRAVFERQYREDRWVSRLLAVYSEAGAHV